MISLRKSTRQLWDAIKTSVHLVHNADEAPAGRGNFVDDLNNSTIKAVNERRLKIR